MYGGTCVDHTNGYACYCPGGYTSADCGTEVDECESIPCKNGAICHDAINGYKCVCNPGYTGINCETEIYECYSLPCRHGGTCNDRVGSYHCGCVPGYTARQTSMTAFQLLVTTMEGAVTVLITMSVTVVRDIQEGNVKVR